MILIPAIDLMGGQAVRLAKGERDRVTVYEPDPRVMVDRFADAGAQHVHIVDLDGAFEGEPKQRDTIAALAARAKERGLQIQTGGGIRDAQTVRNLFDTGVDKVVLGTLAVREPAIAESLCREFPGKLVVAADARDGMVAVSGWQEASDISAQELARTAQAWGAGAILFTDVSRDGMQVGPAVEATAQLQATVEIPVYASGGVGTLEHLDACRSAGIRGVILGRALYEGAFTIEEALARC